MARQNGETVPAAELSDVDRRTLIDDFVKASEQLDKPVRNELGARIMGIVFDRIGRSELKEQPYTGDDIPDQVRPGIDTAYLDYLAVAVDHNHGRGMAANMILQFVNEPAYAAGTYRTYDNYVAGIAQMLQKHLPVPDSKEKK